MARSKSKKTEKKVQERAEQKVELDMVALLELQDLSTEDQELGLREYRIRGIDMYLKDTKKLLDKEEAAALTKYLRLCPSIEQLTAHVLNEHPKSKKWFVENAEKLKKKIPTYKDF